MTSMAFRVGERRGVHQDIHIYVGAVVGHRARVGTLVVMHDEVADVCQGLTDGGFDRVSDTARLLAPPMIEERTHVRGQ